MSVDLLQRIPPENGPANGHWAKKTRSLSHKRPMKGLKKTRAAPLEGLQVAKTRADLRITVRGFVSRKKNFDLGAGYHQY